MPFWGIELKPRKPYTLHPVPGRVLHLSQATLGDGSSSKKSIVQCTILPKGDAISLCALLPDRAESCALNLEFDESDKVKFSVVGKRSVFLTGYFEDQSEYDEHADDDEEQLYGFEGVDDEAEEAYSSEEDDFANFFVDDDDDTENAEDGDFNMFPPSPLPNSGVVIEEIVDDEKLANGDPEKKRHRKKKVPSCCDGNDASQMQLVVKGESAIVVESEDEDGFPIVFPTKAGGNDQIGDIEGEVEKALSDEHDGYDVDDYEKKENKKAESRLKRKSHAIAEDILEKREDDLQGDPAVPSHKAAATEKKRKKKLKVKSDRALDTVHNVAMEKSKEKMSSKSEDILFTGNVEAEIVLSEDPSELRVKKANKNKLKKKNKSKANVNEPNGVEEKTSQSDIPQVSSKIKARTYGNGLVVEELSMGKPDGKKATRGSNVSVRYIGKLQKNGQIFDSNITGKPFKFRLGIGKVIKGWDVGVEGMRIGDKRRLTIPPSMGYGSHGGGKIPANAWLMFDVELLDVK